MSLRAQLLAFGLLTLVLPWAGYLFVQEMEAALRTGFERSLLASAGTVAAALDDQAALLEHRPSRRRPNRAAALYAAPLGGEPRVDGLRDDWATRAEAAFSVDGGHRVWLGVHDRHAYLFFEANDDSIVYESSPGESPYGDRLLLAVEPDGGRTELFLLGTRAPGSVRARRTGPPLFAPFAAYEDRIQSAWQETRDGFSVEVRLPLNLVGDALGIAFIDVDPDGADYRVGLHATWDVEHGAPGVLVQPVTELERLVQAFGQPGDRFRVVDADGWVLTDTGPTIEQALPAVPADGLAGSLFRFLLRRDDPDYATLEARPGRIGDPVLRRALEGHDATAWYRGGPDGNATIVAAVPIEQNGRVLGAVLLEQRSDPILTLTNSVLLRLMTFTLVATLVVALGLLGYATLLSMRVRRLARAAENALGPKGEIDVALPGRRAKDELGDLSRSFANLLERLREHTQYLKTLAGKLSHELRTPLAVVSTSLENLEQEVDSPGARPYLERLRDGVGRLDSILAAMSEATRMEQAIRDTDPQRFDLAAVVAACATAYADIFRDRRIEVGIDARDAEVLGSGELVAQMIDKLIDNAVGFSAAGSTITITLEDRGSELELAVANPGPALPDEMRERLFDSLVSVRKGPHDDGRPHLGLGLYIVALIADFHGGTVTADNLPDGSGAVFRVRFPKRRGG